NYDSVAALSNNVITADSVSLNVAAVKRMAFFGLDFNPLLDQDDALTDQLNLDGEVAQLEPQNYPMLYTQMLWHRALMLDLSLPTFGLLNILALEGQYLKNPNIESIASTYDNLNLTPDENFRFDANSRYKTYHKDDLKWSVHASRNLSEFLTVYVQVAND